MIAAALALSCCDDAASPYFGSTTRVERDAATFHVNDGGEPEYLDPGKCSDGGCAALVTQLFEGLTRYSPEDGHPVQGVARAWEKSDDNRRFRFHLRPDARWSDGRPVTAGDFEYAWKRALRPATASRAAGNLSALKNAEPFRLGKITDDRLVGVRATDDLTLEVELEQPTPYFLDLTSHHAFSPVRRDVIEAFERRGEPDLWTRPGSLVSNGAYVLSGWAFQYQITMTANPFYRDLGRMAIRTIVWTEVEDYHASMNLYKAGELDYLGDTVSPPAEYQARLEGKRDYQRSDLLAVYWYELNTRRPPLDDARVRRALDLAIDKQQLVDRVTRGGQQPATHYVPDFTGAGYAAQVAADSDAGADPFAGGSFDPAAARALLAEAGYAPVREGDAWRAPGFPPLEILFNNGEGHRQLAIAVQAMWKENLGVAASLRSEEWKVMLKSYRDGDFQVMRYGQTADYDHPQTFLAPFVTGNPQNHTGWSDPAFESTMRDAAEAADPAASIRLYRDAERLAVAGRPRLPLYFYTRSTLVKPWVRGFRGSKRNPHAIQFLRVDPEWQRGGPDTFAYRAGRAPSPRAVDGAVIAFALKRLLAVDPHALPGGHARVRVAAAAARRALRRRARRPGRGAARPRRAVPPRRARAAPVRALARRSGAAGRPRPVVPLPQPQRGRDHRARPAGVAGAGIAGARVRASRWACRSACSARRGGARPRTPWPRARRCWASRSLASSSGRCWCWCSRSGSTCCPRRAGTPGGTWCSRCSARACPPRPTWRG